MVDNINRFTAKHPDEMIFPDLNHDQSIDNWWEAKLIIPALLQNLFRELSKTNDPSDFLPKDSSAAPISNSNPLAIVVLRMTADPS